MLCIGILVSSSIGFLGGVTVTVLVRIGDIAQAQHLKVFPSGDRNPNNLVRMEVYKGVIEANFYNGGELQRERFISLLPVDA